jgi:prepilin signal peptidase PulO-like enzyme (type II secretory pathway)
MIPNAIAHGNINFIDKTIQQALIPRSVLTVFLTGISILMTILVFEWCIKWWILLGLLTIALLIAIPAPLRFRSFAKALSIPGLVLRMLKNVLHIDRKNTDFIHTTHET